MDDAAFIRLCEEKMTAFYRVAVSILRRQQDAQDAVQQALLKGWEAREKARAGCEQAWVMRIVINECRNIQRHRMRVIPMETLPEAPWETPDPSLRSAVDALSEPLRLPLLLRYMENMPEKEVAIALGISLPAVKSRLHRARRFLRAELNEEVEWP